MSRFHVIACVLAASAFFASPAAAQSSGFAIAVQVIDRDADPALHDALPLPPAARAMGVTGTDGGRSYGYAGELDAAAAFYDDAMPRRGCRLHSRAGDPFAQQQVWNCERSRVLLRLQRVLGSVAATRIRVYVGAGA